MSDPFQCWCGAIGEHKEHWHESPEAAEAALALFCAQREASRYWKPPWTDAPPDPARAERAEKHRVAKNVVNEINRARIAVAKMLGVIPKNVEPSYWSLGATALGMYDELPGGDPGAPKPNQPPT